MHKIDGQTQLIGLLGWPVSHSFSPAMHNAAAAAAGLNWVYLPLPVHPDRLATAVSALPALGFRGVNVTVPHKQTVIPFLQQLTPQAQAIGAVNTIVVTGDCATPLLGHNTDGIGFLADLAAFDLAVDGRDCLLLGAGGSARAVAYALAEVGGRVTVLARRPVQAEELVTTLHPFLPHAVLAAAPLAELPSRNASLHAPLIVNCTPLGMHSDAGRSVWPEGVPFPADGILYDLIYNPAETKLMRQAAAAGCRVMNGRGMLIRQGAASFTMWTGIEPDVAVMSAAVS